MVFHASSMILCCNQYTKDDLRVQDGILRKYICLFPIILFKCICIGQISCFARFSSTFLASSGRIWTFSLATFVFHPLFLLQQGEFGLFPLLCSFFIHFICFDGAIWTFFLLHSQLSAKQNNSHNNQHCSHCRR